jgi:hypothetical protein
LVPFLRAFIMPLLHTHIAAIALARELLDPYLSRLQDAVISDEPGGRGQRVAVDQIEKRILSDCRWLLLGFGAPCFILMSVPLVGALGWGYAQAAAALLCQHVYRLSPPPPGSLPVPNNDNGNAPRDE